MSAAYIKARQVAVDGVVDAARYWASADESGNTPDDRSIEDACEELVAAVDLLDRIEGRK